MEYDELAKGADKKILVPVAKCMPDANVVDKVLVKKEEFNPLEIIMKEIASAKLRKCKSVRIGPTQMRLCEGEPDEIDSLVQALDELGYGVSVHASDDYPSPMLRISW